MHARGSRWVYVSTAVAALLLIGLGLWRFRPGMDPIQADELAKIKRHRSEAMARLVEGGRSLPGDDRLVALHDLLLDGRLTREEYADARELFYKHYEVTTEEWDRMKGKAPSREVYESIVESFFQMQFAAIMSEWFKSQMPTEMGVRDEFVAQTLEQIENSPDHRFAMGQFTSLNVMGVLATDKSVRDRAVVGLQKRTEDAGVQEFISAWVNAEKLVREQRGGSPAGR